METKHANLVAVNGKPITTYGFVRSIAFNIAGFELETSFIIVQDLPQEDFILGRTFIRTHDVLLDLNQRTMPLRRPKPHLVPAVPEDAPQAQLELAEDVTVEPAGINYIDLQLKYGSGDLFESSDVMIWSDDNSNLIVGRTLATIDSRGRTVATLLNLTQQPITLSRGSPVASCPLIETQDLSIETEQTQNQKFDESDKVDIVNSLNEMINSCFNSSSSTSNASPTDVFASNSKFPTDPPEDD